MKDKAIPFIDSAIDSLFSAIKIFDDLSFPARQETVLMLLNHAFEMLLKGAVLKETGRLRAKKERHNYSFAKCLRICFFKLKLFDETSHVGLKIINSLRDAAAHDVLELNEGVLAHFYIMAVIIFHDILGKISKAKLNKRIPVKKILIRSRPQRNFSFYMKKDFSAAKRLLKTGKKRRQEALIKLRPYVIVENDLREVCKKRTVINEDSIIKKALEGKEIKELFPLSIS